MSQGSFKIFSIVYKELYICLFMATSYKTFNSGTKLQLLPQHYELAFFYKRFTTRMTPIFKT